MKKQMKMYAVNDDDEDACQLLDLRKLFLNKVSKVLTMVNLVWANAYISGYVWHKSIGIIVGNSYAFHTVVCVYLLQNWQSRSGMQSAPNSVFYCPLAQLVVPYALVVKKC